MSNRRSIFATTLILFGTFSFNLLGTKPSNDSFHNEIGQRDFEAVQEFVNSKRTIPLEEKDCCLKFHGDIKVDLLWRNESHQGIKIRGGIIPNSAALNDAIVNGVFPPEDSPTRFDQYTGEAEWNFRLDYKDDCSWGKAHMKFDTRHGVFDNKGHSCSKDPQGLFGSGECRDFCLRSAYYGWNLLKMCDGGLVFDVEVGRRRLFQFFDSRIEFSSQADGVVFNLKRIFKDDWKVYAILTGFVADERINNFVWATEVGALDFFETKFDLKYSFIDWDTINKNRCNEKSLGTKFRVSQFSVAYNFKPQLPFCKKARIYGAYLINTDALETAFTNGRKANDGWYLGLIMGDVKEPGDWSFDMNYQWVEAQAIPDADVFGIGRGNALKDRLYAPVSLSRGAANYKGWHFEYLWQFTKCIFFDVTYDYSTPVDDDIGGAHFYSKAEFDVIYKF